MNTARPLPRPAATVWLLVLVLLLAGGLRLLHLSRQSFWLDEVMTVNTAREAVPSLAMSGTSPPLYYLLMHYWMKLVPESEATARLPSVICGVAAVLLLYLLGRRLVDARAGLVAALLLAVSPFHIHYSQEARTYSLMVLLALLSWLALIRVLERGSPGRIIIWAVCSFVLLLSHNYAVFLLATQVVFVLVRGHRHGLRPGRWLVGVGLLLLLSLPWLRVLMIMIESLLGAEYWIRPPVAGDFVRLYRMMCSDSGWLMKIDLLLVLAAMVFWWWRAPVVGSGEEREGAMKRSALPLLVCWIGLPAVMMAVASWTVMPLYQHRYALALLPPFLLLVAWGATGHGHRPLALVLVGLVLCFTVTGVVDHYLEENRHPWREATGRVSGAVRPGDGLLIIDRVARKPFLYYYGNGRRPPTKTFSRLPHLAAKVESGVGVAIERHRRLWAVVSHCDSGVLQEILERRLGPDLLLEHWAFHGIDVYCYQTGRPERPQLGSPPGETLEVVPPGTVE